MAHGITKKDTMMSVRDMPWHIRDTKDQTKVLDEYPGSVEDAMVQSGLKWRVIQQPVYVPDQFVGDEVLTYREIPNTWVNIREDTQDTLGVVTNRYKPIQNADAFDFLDNLLGGDLEWETAGSIWGGKRVWVLAKVPEYIEVGGDPTAQYVFFMNAHDGKASCISAVTPVRIVCANTLGWAVSKAEASQRTYTVRHTGDISSKIHEARRVMSITVDYYKQFKQMGDELALEPMSQRKMTRVLEKLMPTEEGMGDRAVTNREVAREAIMDIFVGRGADGDTTGNAPGTKWAAANAIAEYSDWNRKMTVRGNQVARSFIDNAIKQRGLELVKAA